MSPAHRPRARASDDAFADAIRRIDEAHAGDPRTIELDGRSRPRELVYAERLVAWVERLDPEASPALRLAARCQHLCRWRIPRREFPQGRAGYHAWRKACQEMHAELAAELLEDAGIDGATIQRVQDLVRKRGLRTDPETQTLEDAACLVFLEHELAAFAGEHEDEKVIEILKKTWRKMTPKGQQAALALELPEPAGVLVSRALG